MADMPVALGDKVIAGPIDFGPRCFDGAIASLPGALQQLSDQKVLDEFLAERGVEVRYCLLSSTIYCGALPGWLAAGMAVGRDCRRVSLSRQP